MALAKDGLPFTKRQSIDLSKLQEFTDNNIEFD